MHVSKLRKNGLSDSQAGVLHYFLKDRYVTKSYIDRWPTGLVDKFSPQLEALAKEIEVTPLGSDGACSYVIKDSYKAADAF